MVPAGEMMAACVCLPAVLVACVVMIVLGAPALSIMAGLAVVSASVACLLFVSARGDSGVLGVE